MNASGDKYDSLQEHPDIPSVERWRPELHIPVVKMLQTIEQSRLQKLCVFHCHTVFDVLSETFLYHWARTPSCEPACHPTKTLPASSSAPSIRSECCSMRKV
jgi:hypothetical protein